MVDSVASGETIAIADGSSEALTSDEQGQVFQLGAGASASVAGAPLLTIDDLCVTIQNFGSAASTGETATLSIQADQALVENDAEASIRAEDTAIRVEARRAAIFNDGLIAGDRNAVDFANGGDSSGSLFNFGSVTSDSRAVNIGGQDVKVYNHGEILGTGDQRNGTIYADGSADRYKIVNYAGASIDAGDGQLGAAISLQTGQAEGDVVKARIYNYGTIQGRGGAEDTSPLAGDGIRIFSGAEDGGTTFRGNLVNYGMILSSEAASGSTAAVRLVDGVAWDGRLVNGSSGVIEGAANAIYFGDGAHDLDLLNYGTIRSDGDAIVLEEVAAFSGSITNRGMIVGNADSGETGVGLRAESVTVDLTIVNDGTILGDVLLGSGDDRFDGADGALAGTVIGGDGDDVIASGRLDDYLVGDVVQRDWTEILDEDGDRLELLSDPAGDDSLYGGAGDDTITGDYVGLPSVSGVAFVGNDLLHGGDGNDRIAGDVLTYDETRLVGIFDDELDGQRVGLDTIYGGEGDDIISGDIFGDVAGGDGGPGGPPGLDEEGEPIDGEGGRDGVDGPRPGVDTIFGGAGDDVIYGDASGDKRAGRVATDVVPPAPDPDPDDGAFIGFNGSPGQPGLPQDGGDSLFGGEGNDVLFGDVGGDILDRASSGSDLLVGGAGDDTLVGDAGGNIFEFSAGLDDRLYGGAGDDVIVGDAIGVIDAGSRAGDDTVEGGAGDDRIFGDAMDENNGEGGDDSLDGGTGNDLIVGGSGEDRIEGAEGGDRLIGGADADRFVYRAGDGGLTVELVDVITDFQDGTDLVELVDGLTFGTGAGQAQFIQGGSLGLGTDSDDSLLVITDGNGNVTEALAILPGILIENLDATDIFVGP